MDFSNHYLHSAVAAILQVRATRREAPLTYKCLAEKIELDTSGHFSVWLTPLSRALNWIDAEDRQLGRPRRSSLVVCRKNGRPGKGYWKAKKVDQKVPPAKWQVAAHKKEVHDVLDYYSKDSLGLTALIVRRFASLAKQ